MRNFTFVLLVLAFLLIASAAFAAGPFTDVPADHWAYAAVSELADLGLVEGFPDKTFRGNNTMTRYEVSILVARIWYKVEETLAGGGSVDPEAIAKIEKLANEFRTELADLGVQVDNIMATLDEQGSEIDRLKSMIHDTNITGSVRFRTGGFFQNQAGIDPVTGQVTDLSTDVGHEMFGNLNFHFMPNDVMDFDMSFVYATVNGPLAGMVPSANDGTAKPVTPPMNKGVTDVPELDVAKLTVDLTPWVTWFGDTPTFTIGNQYFSFGEFGLTGDNGYWSDFGYRFDTSWGTNWNAWLGAYRIDNGVTWAGAAGIPNNFINGPSRSFQSTWFTTESDDFVIAGLSYNGAEGTVPGHDYTYDVDLSVIPNGYGEEFYVGGSANFEIPWMAGGPWINGIRGEGVWVNTNVSDRDPADMGLDEVSWVADLDIYNNGTTKFVGSFAQITQLEGLPVYSNVDNDPFSEWDVTAAASGDAFNISREGKNYFPADFNGFGVSAEHTFTSGLFGKVIFYDGERRNSRFTDRPGLLRVMFKYPIYDNATVGLDIINAGMTEGLSDTTTLVRGELLINF